MEKSVFGELPLGLGMALAQRPQAMERFSQLSDGEKQSIIDQAHATRSRGDMQALVEQLLD